MPSFWSVERDGDAIVATCPEALRYLSDDRADWMARCAAALRDELRLLKIAPGTLLEATLIGDPSRGADLENVLLDNVGVPAAQLHAGVRLRRMPAGGAGVVQRYRRVPVVEDVGDDPAAVLAQVRVPITDGSELETARHAWLAVRRSVVEHFPAGTEVPPGPIELRVRVVVRDPGRGSTELVKVLGGVVAAFHVYGGAHLEEVVRRLALELGEDPERVRTLVSSPRGALLGGRDCFSLRGDRVQVSPADDRIHAAEVVLVAGAVSQLEIELRAMSAA